MLVLSRREGESLVLSNGVEIAILQIRGNKVRVGIKSPAHLFVYRREMVERNPDAYGKPLVLKEVWNGVTDNAGASASEARTDQTNGDVHGPLSGSLPVVCGEATDCVGHISTERGDGAGD